MVLELFRGTPASPRSDIYALGVLLFHTLSGRLPFVAESVGQLIQLHQNQPIPDMRQVVEAIPEALVEINAGMPGEITHRSISRRLRELADSLERTIHRQRNTETLVREAARDLNSFYPGIWRHVPGCDPSLAPATAFKRWSLR